MSADKILVFIPMYNCEKQIPRVLAKFDENIQKLFCEIIVVDNGSKDGSLNAAREALSKLSHVRTSLFKNCDNYSLGGSHKVAFNYALKQNYDYVVVLHGDDQGSITDLVPYIINKEFKKYDSFLGSRFAAGSKTPGYSLFRIAGNLGLNFLCSLVTGYWITDMGSGLNVYDSKYLQSKFYLYFPNNLTFNVFMVFYGAYVKSKFKFFPLTWVEEDQVSNAKVFEQGFRILGLLLEYLFSAKALFAGKTNTWSEIDYKSEVIYTNKIRI